MRARFEGDLYEYFYLSSKFVPTFLERRCKIAKSCRYFNHIFRTHAIYIRINADAQNSSKSSASKKGKISEVIHK